MMADRPMPQVESRQPQQPGQQPHQLPGSKQPTHAPETKNVPLPAQSVKPSKWEDISEYEAVSDWVYIVLAILVVDVFVLCLARYFPEFFGKMLNVWYNRFKLSAVISDVMIIAIGFGITRYLYSEFIYPTYDWNPLYFTGTAVGVQIIHDILFYFGILKQLPKGHNAMIDTMREYGDIAGYQVILGDAGMIVGSSVLAMLLKGLPAHLTVGVGLVTAYVLPYILETQNMYSTLS